MKQEDHEDTNSREAGSHLNQGQYHLVFLWTLFAFLAISPPLNAAPFPIQITELMYHPVDGSEFEFIEIQNTGTTDVDLSHASWEGIEFRFGESEIISPDEIWILASNDNPEVFLEKYPGTSPRGYFAKKLSNSGESLTLIDQQGRALAWVSYQDQGFWSTEADGEGYSLERVRPNMDANSPIAWRPSRDLNGSPGSVSFAPRIEGLQISEIYAASDPANPEESDFVELWNPSTRIIDLSGWSITDKPDQLDRFTFGNGMSISAGGYLTISLTPGFSGASTANFALNIEGETVLLINPDGQGIDGLRFGQQIPGYSISRHQEEWYLSEPNPGEPNRLSPTAAASFLSINEWQADAEAGDSDWIELYNTSDSLPMSLAGLCIGHGAISDLAPVEVVLSPYEADWQFFPGTASPSPEDLTRWTRPETEVTTWDHAEAPFWHGPATSPGTELDDMSGKYTSLLMRREFELSTQSRFDLFRVKVRSDDGFIVWFNGAEWGRLQVSAGPARVDLIAANDGQGAFTDWSFDLENFPLFFKDGVNTIAVQGIATELTDEDFFIDLSLVGVLPPESAFQFRGVAALPQHSFIPPNGFLRLNASRGSGVEDLPFRLPPEGTILALLTEAEELLTSVTVSVASEGISEGRFPDGTDNIIYLTSGPSPGHANTGDSDGDGIPDEIERQYSLDPEDPTDALSDQDGDGFNNLQEFKIGTDLNEAQSVLGIQRVNASQANTLGLRIPKLRGHDYSLEETDRLAPPEWKEIYQIQSRRDEDPSFVDLEIARDKASSFYRITGFPDIPEPAPTSSVLTPLPGTIHQPSEAITIGLANSLDPSSINNENDWRLTDAFNRPVAITVRYDSGFTKVMLRPEFPLLSATDYVVSIGPSLQTRDGNSIANEIGPWSFRTSPAPPLTDNQAVYNEDTDDVIRIDISIGENETPYVFEDLLNDNSKTDDFAPYLRVRVEGEGYSPSQAGTNGTMRVRGASSRAAIQKSFRIDLDSSEIPWRGHRRLHLSKHPFELTRVRNRLSFELFEQIPHTTSLRTQYVHLFVNGDDLGLFSQIEDYGESFLASHGLDPKGHLYKANFFEWFRYPENLKLKTDPSYSKDAFEIRLEIETRDDHGKLLRLLDDLNNPDLDFARVFNQYFNRENYLTWLACNLLTGNIDTNSQNFLLYSPSDSQTWYFLPWDYDGAWGLRRQPDNLRHQFPRWQEGLATYWNVPLHRRFMQIDSNREALEQMMTSLANSQMSLENIERILTRYRPIVESFISREPDIKLLPVSRGEARTNIEVKLAEWAGEFDRLSSEIAFNESLYYLALQRPMPIFLGTPQQGPASITFTWSESSHLLQHPVTYDFTVSSSPYFESDTIIADASGLDQLTIDIDPISTPGDYYFRVIVRDTQVPETNWQIPFSALFDAEEGRSFYGLKKFSVN